MRSKRKFELLRLDSASVVADSNQIRSAPFDQDLDQSRTCINAIFKHLFDDTRRPLDDFTRSDFIDQTYRQLSYDWHPSGKNSLESASL
jgi:hypothetical protein